MLGELAALLTALCWTGSALSFAAATVRVGSVYVNITRLLLAALFLVAVTLLFGLYHPLSFRQLVFLALSGFVGLAFGDTFLFKSFEYVTARVSMLVMSTVPAITALLGFAFLQESLTLVGVAGIAVTLAGIGLVVGGRKDPAAPRRIEPAGLWYAFLGALGQAGGLILAKGAFMEGPVDGMFATLIRILASIVLIVPMTLAARRYTEPVKVFTADRKALGLTALGAMFGPVAGITFSLIAISHTTTAIAATIMATVPIFILPASWLIHHERVGWQAVAGAVVAVGGVAVLFLR